MRQEVCHGRGVYDDEGEVPEERPVLRDRYQERPGGVHKFGGGFPGAVLATEYKQVVKASAS